MNETSIVYFPAYPVKFVFLLATNIEIDICYLLIVMSITVVSGVSIQPAKVWSRALASFQVLSARTCKLIEQKSYHKMVVRNRGSKLER